MPVTLRVDGKTTATFKLEPKGAPTSRSECTAPDSPSYEEWVVTAHGCTANDGILTDASKAVELFDGTVTYARWNFESSGAPATAGDASSKASVTGAAKADTTDGDSSCRGATCIAACEAKSLPEDCTEAGHALRSGDGMKEDRAKAVKMYARACDKQAPKSRRSDRRVDLVVGLRPLRRNDCR
ncbi:MAG TPA: hypothetical protein VM925_33260 [Labilithrix sp.]|jgi:hypothetical protein|nr:hypothetical protein [Labilithrix sp.]